MKSGLDESIYTSLYESTLDVECIDGAETFVITREKDCVDDIKLFLKTTFEILASDEVHPFSLKQINNLNYVQMTKLGKRIRNVLKTDINAIREYFNTHEFHPVLELPIREADDKKLFSAVWHIDKVMEEDAANMALLFNDFVKRIRTVASSTEFKDVVRRFERRSKGNSLEFKRYINAHFENRSRLLFLRLDLGYNDSYLSAVERDVEVVHKRIKKDWKRFYLDLNRKILKKHLLGFVRKLEYGLNKSLHLHLLLILDSSALKSSIKIGKIVGDHWVKWVTENRGNYYNCNAKKDSYRFCGIGQIHRDDLELRENLLNRVGGYLTKSDIVVSLKTPDGGRAFSKGIMPKSTKKIRRIC